MTAAAGEGRNNQTTTEGPGTNHIVGVFPDVFGAQEDLLPQLDGDGLGSNGRAPNTMTAAEGRHHHQTTVRMFGD